MEAESVSELMELMYPFQASHGEVFNLTADSDLFLLIKQQRAAGDEEQ